MEAIVANIRWIPLYPSEELIAELVLGPGRLREWRELAQYLEDRKGFPPRDHLMGGRSWAKVQAFFRLYDGETDPANPSRHSDVRILPKAPDRLPEDDAFNRTRRRRRPGPSDG
jgi:hypothetical protein